MAKFVLDVETDFKNNDEQTAFIRHMQDFFSRHGYPYNTYIEPINDYLSRMSEQDKDYE